MYNEHDPNVLATGLTISFKHNGVILKDNVIYYGVFKTKLSHNMRFSLFKFKFNVLSFNEGTLNIDILFDINWSIKKFF